MANIKYSYKFIDLFAGLGGFHQALNSLGCKCVFASELKEDLQKLYSINYPGVRIEGDITKVDVSTIPEHDILCGGFPCQPVSQAGNREGFQDKKNRGNLCDYICAILEVATLLLLISESAEIPAVSFAVSPILLRCGR